MREEGGADGKKAGHGADHERGVRHSGDGEAIELQKKLQRNAEERAEGQELPFPAAEVRAVGEQQRSEAQDSKGEPLKDHRSDVHFSEGDLAEKETATPERAGERAGGEAEGAAVVWGCGLGFDAGQAGE